MPNGFLVTDADNTLWDTNRVFAEAQTYILDQVEALSGIVADTSNRLAFVRCCDQAIAQTHEAGLKYPPHLLVAALVAALKVDPLSDDKTEAIVSNYLELLGKKPRLRAGVRGAITSISEACVTIIVASEGRQDRVQQNLDEHGLTKFVDDIVTGKKSRAFFDELFARSGACAPKICVGDQLDRDIAPAKAAGFFTLYFPGGFRPSWEFSLSEEGADRVIKSYDGVKDAFLLKEAA